jgi:hypothetical protein
VWLASGVTGNRRRVADALALKDIPTAAMRAPYF